MSTEKMPIATEKTAFEYNALGQVARICSEESDTYNCYYPIPADAQGTAEESTAADDVNTFVPALDDLLSAFTMADNSPLTDALKLCCPTMPNEQQPPILGLLQLNRAPNGDTLLAKLTLFGYHLATHDAKGLLTPDTVLTLENVAVDSSVSPWAVSQAEGIDGLRISLQQSTRSADRSSSTQTVTTWFKDNRTRLTHTLNETFDYDPVSHTHLLRTTTTPIEGDHELEPVLSQQVRSALSGSLLCQSRQDDQGRPVSEIHHLYDVRGRNSGSYILPYDTKTFRKGADRDTKGLGIQRRETGNGTWVTVAGPDGRCGRTLYDGLQRPVRHELQRYPGADHGANNYCLIHDTRYGADGKVVEQNLYDYLPGGLRRRQRNQQLPARLNDWFWKGETSNTSLDAAGNKTQITEQTLGSMNSGLRCTVRQTLTSLPDGTCERHQQRWTGHETDLDNQSIERKKKFDTLGRVVEVEEKAAHSADAKSQTSRVWRMEYDALNRKTKQRCPGDMTIEYSYEGYATSPVKLTVRQGQEVRVLGSRTLKGNGLNGEQVLTMTRGDAAREGALAYAYQDRNIALPDQSKITSELNANGEDIDYFVEHPGSNGAKPKKTLLISFKRAPLARAIRKERHAVGEHQGHNIELASAAALLGTYSVQQQARGTRHRHTAQGSLRGEVEQVRHANGAYSRIWRDANGRVRRVRRDVMEYLYEYTAAGEVQQLRVKGASADQDLEMNSTYDALGHETSREYRLAGKPVVRHERTWSAAGQLLSKRLYRDGATSPVSHQTYTYDALRGWLLSWSIEAQEGEQALDSSGHALTGQTYQYDMLANLTQCRSERTDGTVEIRDYTYHATYATRRESVKVTLLDNAGKQTSQLTVKLSYDANGNLSVNERGQHLSYTPTGRLASVSDDSGLLTSYEFDADDRLIGQWNNVRKERHLLAYSGDRLCMEILQNEKGEIIKRRILDEEAGLVVQVFETSDDGTLSKTLFNLIDPQDGGADQYHFAETGQWVRASVAFTPWGEAQTLQVNKLEGCGFNGQRIDPITGCYHLGNGYRCYDPLEKCFWQPDDWSPFGLGGLNDRAYCAGDPVNWHDPSGHFMINRQGAASHLASLDEMIRDTAPPVHPKAAWWEWLLLGVFVVVGAAAALMTGGAMAVFILGLLVVGTALDIASLAIRHTNPRLSAKLGYAALAVGFVDVAFSGLKAIFRGLSWVGRQVGRVSAMATMKFGVLSKTLRRAGREIRHFDNLADIGSSASKTRAARATNKLGQTFDIGSESKYLDSLVDDPLGITTWGGGRQMGFTPLNANSLSAGGVYAIVDHAHLGNTIVSNVVEIEEMKKLAESFVKTSKKLGKFPELDKTATAMEKQASAMQKTAKSVEKEHLNLKLLKQQHQQALDKVVTLKGAHEELIGLRTQHSEFFLPNSTTRHFGRTRGIPSLADDMEMMSIARPSAHADFHDELIKAIDDIDQELVTGTEVRNASKNLESLPATDLDNVPYKVIDPLTGESSTEAALLDRYFRTTLTQKAAIHLQNQKTERLHTLAKITGDEEGLKKFRAIAEKQAAPEERRRAFQMMHRELVNSCMAKHAAAVNHLETVNKKLSAQASAVHDLFDKQAEAHRLYCDTARQWKAKALASDAQGANSALLSQLPSSLPPMTTPSLRLRVFGHLENLGVDEVARSRFGLRVETAVQLSPKQMEAKQLLKHGEEIKIKGTVEYWNPETLNEKLIDFGLDPKYFDEIDLVMCNSATGGQSSFAQKFNQITDMPVRGYEGNVTSTGFIEASSSWNMVPDSRNPGVLLGELTEHMGHSNNAGYLARVESYYEGALSTQKGTVDFLEAGRIAGREASNIYLDVLKTNNRYNNYIARRFSSRRPAPVALVVSPDRASGIPPREAWI